MLLIIFLMGVLLLVWGLPRLAAQNRRKELKWPLFARPILTDRERDLYRRLQALYLQHIVLAQFALSQLLDVQSGSPRAIRNHFSQLVADFVVCRRDFSIVAVIELDDASHRGAGQRDADARKTKAVESAGLQLVRILAGALPSDAELRAQLLERNGEAEARGGAEEVGGSTNSRRIGEAKGACLGEVLCGASVVRAAPGVDRPGGVRQ